MLIIAVALNLFGPGGKDIEFCAALQLLQLTLVLLVVARLKVVVQSLLKYLVDVEAAIAKICAHSFYYTESISSMLATRLTAVLRKFSTGGGRPIVMSEAVRYALEKHMPIVAQESTIISHGMPYPQNL